MWTQDSQDSLGANYAGIIRNVEAALRPGAIILMHENRGQTIRALTTLLPVPAPPTPALGQPARAVRHRSALAGAAAIEAGPACPRRPLMSAARANPRVGTGVGLPAMTYATLRYELAATGVATIALDQPETRNALSDELLAELLAALEQARDDPRRALRRAHLHPREGVLQRRQPRRLRRRCRRSCTSTSPPSASRPCSACWASWASRRSAPPTATCWRARSASRWPAT